MAKIAATNLLGSGIVAVTLALRGSIRTTSVEVAVGPNIATHTPGETTDTSCEGAPKVDPVSDRVRGRVDPLDHGLSLAALVRSPNIEGLAKRMIAADPA